MKKYSIQISFIALIITLISFICFIFVENLVEQMRIAMPILALSFIVFSTALIFFTIKQKIKGRLRKFLLLTGGSALGIVIFSVAHNLFYALVIITKQIPILPFVFGVLEGVTFIIAIPICPVGFIVGVVGSIIYYSKQRKSTK